ncbi:ArsC family reductase [Asticcacaulis sp. ZE23SCel15]|uniref:ArsC family reductase n=1 Tax=Asticcacaulis sp. ZE23SCel15 TaxID=3059027 RepID=UPI00265F3230|nr:ArsC family reductase [Asticcacaulis sp. ZE23SCel15]WKL56961.1 ArsC family reductase [Asticcacaulis sp. ZE23SCel15]
MAVKIYGIKNCDTMAKARRWLEARGVEAVFHDYKALGIEALVLKGWADRIGWQKLINTSGQTFRKLPDEDRADLDEAKALRLMQAQPSMIRRPILDTGDQLIAGFKPDIYENVFK